MKGNCRVCGKEVQQFGKRGPPRLYCSHECYLSWRYKLRGSPRPRCLECHREMNRACDSICTACSRRSGQGRWRINQQERLEKIIRILMTDSEITYKQIAERFGCKSDVVTRAARILEERRRGAA